MTTMITKKKVQHIVLVDVVVIMVIAIMTEGRWIIKNMTLKIMTVTIGSKMFTAGEKSTRKRMY